MNPFVSSKPKFSCNYSHNIVAMTSGPETIKLLLKAEEEASSVVEQARKGNNIMCFWNKVQIDIADRESRLKQATQEAQRDINAYRQEKEREYQEELKKVRIFTLFSSTISNSLELKSFGRKH